MKLTEFPLLTDENIDAAVVQLLRNHGFDVFDVTEQGLFGTTDTELLRRATVEGRVIVTHDSDFGTLAIFQGEPVVGVIYLRPGHIDPRFTIGTFETLLDIDPDVQQPFLLVARRRAETVTIRIRRLPK